MVMYMSHKEIREQLVLKVYGELQEDELRMLDEHLEECAACRRELHELKELHAIACRSIDNDPGDKMLFEARTRLKNTLNQPAADREKPLPFPMNLLHSFASPGFRWAYARVLPFILIGVALGYLMKNSGGGNSVKSDNPSSAVRINDGSKADTFENSGVRIENLQFKDSDASDGEVAFSFDAVKPVEMKGSIDDKMIRKVLTTSLLNSRNDGERLRALNKIAANTHSENETEVHLSDKVKSALIHTIKFDNNPGVRREALILLGKNGFDSQVESTLLYVLNNDKNSGMRVMAIKALQSGILSQEDGNRRSVSRDLIETLKAKSEADGNKFVKLSARTVLQEVEQ